MKQSKFAYTQTGIASSVVAGKLSLGRNISGYLSRSFLSVLARIFNEIVIQLHGNLK